MNKVLFGVIATIVVLAFLIPFALNKAYTTPKNEVDQIQSDNLRLVNAGKSRQYIENRILGISHLISIYADSPLSIPEALREEAVEDQKILSTMKASLEGVISLLDNGDTSAADSAYQLIKSKTDKATALSIQRRDKIRNDFRDALGVFYGTGISYSESEWAKLKSDTRSRLIDRDTQNARSAYLIQPADNIQIGSLTNQLELLGEAEQLVFFYKQDYEISYKLLKNYGSLSSALNYGVALNRFTEDSAQVIDVLKEPITQIMTASTEGLAQYYEPLNAYFSALKKQQNEQEFEQFSQTIVNSVTSNVSYYDKQWENAAKFQSVAPEIKADSRVRGAQELYQLNIVDHAIVLLEEAKELSKDAEAYKVDDINRLIEEYQRGVKQPGH